MSNLSTLCSELKAVTGQGSVTLPNSAVTAVDLNSFITNIFKTNSIALGQASVACDDSTVTLTGTWMFLGAAVNITWSFTEGGDGSITWGISASSTSTSSVNTVLQQFLSDVPDIPSSVSGLQLTQLGFDASLNTTTKQYQLDLKATTNWGSVELLVQDNNGTWGAALGISVSDTFTLSKIDSDLTVFNSLSFSDSAIVVADFADSSIPIAGITGVVKGVEFRSTLSVNETTGTGALAEIMNELAKSLSDVPLSISLDLSATDFKLEASIDKPLSLPGFSKLSLSNIDFTLDTTPSASLAGTLDLPITIPADPTVNSISVTGSIDFVYSDGTGTVEATLNSNTLIKEPFNFYGVTLQDVGVGLDVSFGVETGAGVTLEGAFQLGRDQPLSEKFAVTMEFTDDVPNPSLLYVESKNLSLPTLFNALIDSSISLPSVLSGFQFTDLTLYWCDKAQTLPDGTSCKVGYGYNAAIDFWGFDTYSALMINQGSGITGTASTNPISLLGGKISLTGNGTGGKGVQAGGPYFNFDTSKESFDVSVDANILGITEVVNANVSPTSLDINMKSNFGFLQDSLAVTFKNGGADMAFSSSLNIGINASPSISIGSVNLGTIHIDDSLSGSIDVSFQNGVLSAPVNGSFNFNGASFGFNYDVGTSLTDLGDLAGAIAQKIESEAESIFHQYFSDVKNYIDVVGKGLLTGGDFVLNVLYHAYTTSISEILDLISDLPSGFKVNGTVDFEIKIAPSIPSESFHADLGHILNTHGDAHGDHSVGFLGHFDHSLFDIHGDISASQGFSTPGFSFTLLDIHPQQHFDMTMPPTVHADATSPHIDASPHLDLGIAGGSLGVGGNVDVNSSVALNDISLQAHLNVSAHAGVHADVLHVGGHGDTGTHIDQGLPHVDLG